jgi:hypothetical protein
LDFECEEIEGELFSLRVKQDITFLPMKKYIEEWLERSLAQIINLE